MNSFPKIITYSDPKSFWEEVSPHLKKEEAKNSLCLGLSYRFRNSPQDCVYQSAIFENGKFVGALVLSKYRTNYNLLPASVANEKVCRLLYEEFIKSNHPVTGIVGEKSIALVFKDIFESTGKQIKVNMEQGIYSCDRVKMPMIKSNVTFRVAQLSEAQKIGEWINEFHNEAVPHDPPVNGVELAEAKIGAEMIFVIEENEKLVSMAAWSRDIETSCSVNLVYTPKHLRKRGFGSLVTAHLTQYLLDSGKKETNLYTDMSNPTSNKIYKSIGYEFVCDSIHYGFM